MRFVILTLLIMLTFSGPAWAKQPVVGFVTGASGLGDLSFNDMSYGGVRKAQQEFNFKLIILEPGRNGESTEKDFTDLIQQCDVLLLIGAQHEKLVRENSPNYPDKKFIVIEVPVRGMNNVSSVAFNQKEGSFLAGALAALMSKTGKIGFIGGTRVPPVADFELGYVAGAEYAVPDIKIDIDYVSPPGDFSGFQNPQKGYAMAMNQYRNGADTIFTVAGLTGNGIIEAARSSGKFAIGVDSDQDSLAKGTVLTSMIKKLDVACYNELKSVMLGHFTPGPSYYGLKENGVGLSRMLYTRSMIPDEIFHRISELRDKIIKKEISVEPAPSPHSTDS